MVKKQSPLLNDYLYAYIFGIGGFIIILILIFVVGKPLYNDMVKNQAELKTKQQELSYLEDRLETLKQLDSKKEALITQNQKVLSALPVDKDVARLFVQVENIANQNGIAITSVKETTPTPTGTTTAATPSGGLKKVTYTISGTVSNYPSTKAALAKIESALRVASVSKVDISGKDNNLTVNLTVETYVRGS